MGGRMNGRTDVRMDVCSTGLHPLWVCCPASLCITFKNDEQGTGTADHMISLDYLFSFRSWNQKQIAVPNLKSTKARNDHENQFANGFLDASWHLFKRMCPSNGQ